MSTVVPSDVRRRRSPAHVREEAIRCARKLLVERGPDAVTLKAVAGELGMTHANVLHHFGSAAALQAAVMSSMIEQLTGKLGALAAPLREGRITTREFVDLIFDALGPGGAGRLASWLSLTGDLERMMVLKPTMENLVREVIEMLPNPSSNSPARVREAVLYIGLMAVGDGVVGPALADMIGESSDTPRALAARFLTELLSRRTADDAS